MYNDITYRDINAQGSQEMPDFQCPEDGPQSIRDGNQWINTPASSPLILYHGSSKDLQKGKGWKNGQKKDP